MSNYFAIRLALKLADDTLAGISVDESMEYVEEELIQIRQSLSELQQKMLRDEHLQKDREAFEEPTTGLKDWLGGG